MMPLPDVAAASAAARPDPMVAATEALSKLPPPPEGGLLGMPSERPSEPVTAGLSTGAGPGPEAIRPEVKGPVTTTLERLAASSGDPVIAAMAATAARRRA